MNRAALGWFIGACLCGAPLFVPVRSALGCGLRAVFTVAWLYCVVRGGQALGAVVP